jgi:1-acyl-sn-glycerol-3-phosphate acyltransferase/nucleoside-diphosphate-sugar epimerase
MGLRVRFGESRVGNGRRVAPRRGLRLAGGRGRLEECHILDRGNGLKSGGFSEDQRMERGIGAIAMIGCLGNLARRTGELLEARGHKVAFLSHGEDPAGLTRVPEVIICFPFTAAGKGAGRAVWARELGEIEKVIRWAGAAGIRRVVLRSSATAYGFSFKNYGLMEEDRVSLLEPGASEMRWLRAERLLLGDSGLPREAFSVAVLRFTNVADPGEGDFIARLFSGRLAVPAAGYDPRVQFVSLEDAAASIVQAAESEASGIFNIAGDGCVEFRRALKAAVPLRIPVGHSIQRPLRGLLGRLRLSGSDGGSVDQIQYNWTISSERAERELGFRPSRSSAEALKEMLGKLGRGKPERIAEDCDEFGLDPKYLRAWEFWFFFLRKIYWRVEVEGLENIPREGPAIMVANHRGFMPFDGVIHRSAILEAVGRHIRFLVIPSLFKFPFLSSFLIKQGGVVASQLNSARLFRRGELVGIFPEGINGAFRMYKGAYRLGAFARDAFARMAIEHQVPVIPGAVVGHVEIFPILARMHISPLMRWTGWPFIPVTPTFPLLPVPLPTKWHVRYMDPISVSPLKPEDADNRRRVREFSQHVRGVLQSGIDDMLGRRRYIFFGSVFDEKAPRRMVATLPGREDS